MSETMIKGYSVSDEQLRKEKGYDLLEAMYTRNPIGFSSINNVTASLFNLRRDKHFDTVCSNPDWQKFFSELFIAYNPPEGLYGHAYDLVDFLVDVFKSILIFGKAFYSIDFAKKEHSQLGTIWTIQRIRWLPPETMSAIFINGRIQGYMQQYSNTCNYKDLHGTRVDFKPDEIFFVDWVFDGVKNRGISPLMRLILDFNKMESFLKFSARYAHAMFHPEDHSYEVERARYTSWDEARKINDVSKLRIKAALDTINDAPMTQYYEIYHLVKSRKRLAFIREYLLNEFNVQVVDNISKKNNLTELARVKLVGYMSEGEIEALFRKFQNGQVSRSEVSSILLNEMIGANHV